nr:hypothetical protein [Tanacetum cinerariifolium]
MPNPEYITDSTTVMNMALALMAKAFKLNYSTPTNNNQRISSNLKNRLIAQPGMNMGQDRQMQMVGGNGRNQFRQYAGQNAGNLNGYNAVQNVENQVAQNPRVQNDGNQNQIGNGNLVANYMQQPMPNPKDITDPTTAMNMSLTLMAKSFKLNYSTPTNNNQRISSNPRNRNQVIQNAIQNPRIQNVGNHNGLIVVRGHANQNLNGNGNLIAARAEGNATGHNGNQIRCYNCRGLGIQIQAEEFDLMAAAADLDEIEEVNANCILMANL